MKNPQDRLEALLHKGATGRDGTAHIAMWRDLVAGYQKNLSECAREADYYREMALATLHGPFSEHGIEAYAAGRQVQFTTEVLMLIEFLKED